MRSAHRSQGGDIVKTFYNSADDYVAQMLGGILAAHADALRADPDEPRAILRSDAPVKNKVAVVTGGGSGHLPVFMGYVGPGLVDGAAIGNVFASPSAGQMLAVTRAANAGKGVLYLYGNYGGDVMNFDTAAEDAEDEGIEVRSVVVADDIASAEKGDEASRRGVAGIFFAYKIAGASAERGMSLQDVAETTTEALGQIRSLGVAIGACTVPGSREPTFRLAENEMEIGMGIHGEAGIHRGERRSADEVTDDLLERLFADIEAKPSDEFAVLINSLGATPVEELYIVNHRLSSVFSDKGMRIHRTYVGRYASSLEMAGFSISLFRVDDKFKALLDHPASTPFFPQLGK